MLSHMLKLVWKRKVRNLMLTLEILLSFVMVFAVAAACVRGAQLYSMPLGFEYKDVWSVEVVRSDRDEKASIEVFDNLLRAVREMPEVERAEWTAFTPFHNSSMTDEVGSADSAKHVFSSQLIVGPRFADVMGLQLTQGRFVNESDLVPGMHPVLINERMAKALFGNEPAVGKRLKSDERSGGTPTYHQVVGVINDYRRGQFVSPANILVNYFALNEDKGFGRHAVLLKLKPGTTRDFEARLSRKLKQTYSSWDYAFEPLADARESQLKEVAIPVVVFGVIAFFMLIMVGFGLFGVLWQNTARRIPEIGLRRAIGASAGQVYAQIVGEQVLLSTLAIAVGLVLLVQLPITGVLGDNLGWGTFAIATVLSAFVIYLISLLCALYPGWRAARLSPTEALHYE